MSFRADAGVGAVGAFAIKGGQLLAYDGTDYNPVSAGRFGRIDFTNHLPVIAQYDQTTTPGTNGAHMVVSANNTVAYLYVYGTSSTTPATIDDDGLVIQGDGANTEGFELHPGMFGSAAPPTSYTVGTDAFFCKWKMKAVDASSHDLLCVGFRKVQAIGTFNALSTFKTGYDDFAVINAEAGDIKSISRLNAGTAYESDLAVTDLADDTFLEVEIRVDISGNVTYALDGGSFAPMLTTAAAELTLDSTDQFIPFFRHHWNATGGAGDYVKFESFSWGLL